MTFFRTEALTDVWEDPTPVTDRRSRYVFKATYNQTLAMLEREIRMLDPDRGWDQTNVVMHVACRPGDLRRDGNLRADARTFTHPGVRLTFNHPTAGDVKYETDIYDLWQHNVRAIALSLEALRAVDRHGVTSRGEQYLGFKALPAGRAMPASHMTSEEAIMVLFDAVGWNHDAPWPRSNQDLWKAARIQTHPDRHAGDQTLWNQVEQAAEVLGLKR